MAAACGIHIDQRRFHFVGLEGNAKKHRIVAHASGEIAPGDDPVDVVAAALRDFGKRNKVAHDNVALAVDSGLAAFRTLTLPFDDPAKIEEVIKFEVENDLPQWDIDQVIVDFLVIDSKPGVQSTLLVTALPKERLATQLEACERGGLEATEAELDGTALFNAASVAGLLGDESAQILLHVGDASTTVVVADGGRLTSIRAIRAGGSPPLLRAAAGEEADVDVEAGEEGERDDEAAIDAAAAAERLAKTSQRIQREVARTISAARTAHPIEAVYVCGSPLPGLSGTIADVPVQPLDAVPAAEGLEDPRALTIAFGAAVHQLGAGGVSPHLRREDLRFTGKLERLELPLAVFGLLLFTLVFVQWIVQRKQIEWRDEGDLSREEPYEGDMQIWLRASNGYMLPDPETGYTGRLLEVPDDVAAYVRTAEAGDDHERTKFQEIRRIKTLLGSHVRDKQAELGQISDITQPQSALEALTLVMGVVDGLGPQVGRFAVRGAEANYVPGTRNQGEYILVKLDMDFFAADSVTATEHYTKMFNELKAQPWCIEYKPRQTDPFDDDSGISVEGVEVSVDLTKVVREQEAVQ